MPHIMPPDAPAWFRPKRYGYGATPVTWQGWLLTLGFVSVVALDVTLVHSPWRWLGEAALLLGFLVLVRRLTHPPMRWRWGGKD